MPTRLRPLVAVLSLPFVYLLSIVGLVDLIGKGYNAMSVVFTVIVLAPLLTVGICRLRGPAMAERD